MFANVRNNEIIDFNCKYLDEDIVRIETTDDMYNAYLEDKNKVMYSEEEIILNPNYEEEQAQKERERLDELSMTALDFIKVLQSFGLTLEQINAYLESNLAVKMQLTYCQNVYCGVVKALMPVTVGDITITADMIETAFKVKNSADSVGGV